MTPAPAVAPTAALDAEQDDDVASDRAFTTMVERLSRISVDKHFDAYEDVPWDDPEMAIEPGDPRWKLWSVDPLARTDWYRSLSDDEKSKLAMFRVASCMKVGWQFENCLQRGLLLWAMKQPNGEQAFRYVHQEIIEESQHTLMFQELVNRTGLPVRGMPRWARVAGGAAAQLPRNLPVLFFFLVLGGEDPIDHVQRQQLADGGSHPLVDRITRIHITEEARHLSFARHYLKHEVPELGRLRRFALSLTIPVVMAIMTRLMLVPGSDLRRRCHVPRSVMKEAYAGADGHRLLADSVVKVRRLCHELGLLGPVARRLWKAGGIWSDQPVAGRAVRADKVA